MNNKWTLSFVEFDNENQEFKTLLTIEASETHVKETFNRIKNEFKENTGEPDCIIDLVDEYDSIIDNYSLTKQQLVSVASLLGFEL